MKDFTILKFLDRFKGLFWKIGVDYPVLRTILQVKLTMDQRKLPTVFSQANQKKEKKEDKYAYIKSLWLYAFMGLILIPLMAFGDNYLFQMSISFGIILFLIMTSMISDFSGVLLDVRDKHILQTKPINRRTINTAKVLHIMIYLSQLTIAITLIPLVVSLLKQGFIFFLMTVVLLVLANLFIVVITALLYLAILRFFDGEKLKDMINYVQIGLSIVIMIGYQVVIRSFELVDLNIVYQVHWWHVFIVPMWFAAPYEWILNGSIETMIILLAAFAIILPIVAIIIYGKLIPSFEKNLEKLTSQSKAKKSKSSKLEELLLSLLINNREEKAFYQFTGQMISQERDFKLKVYPSLGFSIVIPFLFLYSGTNLEDISFATSSLYLTIYFTMINIPTIIMMMRYSGKFKGAWIFTILPISDFSMYYKGALKAVMIKLYLPIYFLISIAFLFLFGIRIIPDLLVVFISAFLYSVICYVLLDKEVPFSMSFDSAANQQSWRLFLLLLPLPILAGIHYISISLPFGIYIYGILLFFINLICWKKMQSKGNANSKTVY
jgi:ABC-2 type transport system permease protein